MRLTLRLIVVAMFAALASARPAALRPISSATCGSSATRSARASSSTSRKARNTGFCASPTRTGWSSTCRTSTFGRRRKPGEGRGLVSDYRYGLIAPGQGARRARPRRAGGGRQHLRARPDRNEPARLVVDMVPTTAGGVRRRDAPGPAGAERPRHAGLKRRRRATSGLPVVVIDPGPRRHRFRRDRQGRAAGEGRHAEIRAGARTPAQGGRQAASRC